METHPESSPPTSHAKRGCKDFQCCLSPVVGLITGGFVARLLLEATGRPWSGLLIVLLGTLLMCVGGLMAWRLDRRTCQQGTERASPGYWPLLLLAVYLIWPRHQPSLALPLLILVGLTALLDGLRRGSEFQDHVPPGISRLRRLSGGTLADVLTFSLSLLVYIATTAPDVLPADSGEFQIAAPLLGVAHPPGYPLYTLLGWAFTKLIPFGDAAYRLNLMSAFFAAGTLTLLGAAARRWARHLGFPAHAALTGGVAAALTLGTATTVWAQATVANIRIPTVCAAALGLYALARFADAVDQHQSDAALVLLALALSLGIGHHPSLIFLGIFFLVYLFLIDPRLLVQPRRWWKPLLVALVGLLPLLYLPLRGLGDAPLAPPNLNTVDGFVHHVTAQGFEGDMFAYANTENLPQRLTLVPTLFFFQFNSVLVAAAALGLLLVAWQDRRLLTLLGGGLILHTFVTITYRAPQTVEYLMPAYLPIAVLVGLTVAWFLSLVPRSASSAGAAWRTVPEKLHAPEMLDGQDAPAPKSSVARRRLLPFTMLLAAAILLAGLTNGAQHAPSYFALARDRSTRAAMESILHVAPPHALILADWHWATSLWYLQWVEGQRSDVDVRYVYPVPGQEYHDTWLDLIEANVGERPVLLTHAYDLPDYTLEPLGQGFWVHQRPFAGKPVEFRPLGAIFARGAQEGQVRLLGYQLSQQQASLGQALELTLAWQALGELTLPPSFTVLLANGEGQRLAQADRYLGSDYTPGEVRFERLALPLYSYIPAGDYALTAQVYSTGDEGFETWSLQTQEALSPNIENAAHLTTMALEPSSTQPLSLNPLSAPFLNGPALVGVDYDRSVPDVLRLYLHWRGPAHGGEQIQVGASTAQLPALSDDRYHTVVLDLPGETAGCLPLTLAGTDGQIKSVAGPWGWSQGEVQLTSPPSTARFVPLADEMALIGVAPAEDESLASGDQLFLRLTFLSLKPLITDNAVSVRLLDEQGRWRYVHDFQPALGAIPTLKWIRGSRVLDPHPLRVPKDTEGNVIRATMVVYERFRGTPLPPMDGRFSSEVPLGEWRLEDR